MNCANSQFSILSQFNRLKKFSLNIWRQNASGEYLAQAIMNIPELTHLKLTVGTAANSFWNLVETISGLENLVSLEIICQSAFSKETMFNEIGESL